MAAHGKVALQLDETKLANLTVPSRQLEYWSEDDGGWKRASGPRVAYLGGNAQDGDDRELLVIRRS